MRQIHDSAHELTGRVLGVVRFALTEEQTRNIEIEIYHLARDAIVRHMEAVALERRRLRPLERGDGC